MHLVKPHLKYHSQYKEMLQEWLADEEASGSATGHRLAPWTLHLPFESAEDFAALIARCEEAERGENVGDFSASSTWWLYDEERDLLVGATNLRHWLTEEGKRTWGHIGYGIRPSERRKGYATLALKTMLKEAKIRGIPEVLLAAYTSNIGSWKTMEHCGAQFLQTVLEDPADPDSEIRQYTLTV